MKGIITAMDRDPDSIVLYSGENGSAGYKDAIGTGVRDDPLVMYPLSELPG